MNPNKTFRLRAEDIRPVATGRGSCFASDMITVEGKPVTYMYREAPNNELDSGWRFLSGLETQAYMEVASNFEIYDVNTIANYDPHIVPFLDASLGSAFERNAGTGRFEPVEFTSPDDA